MGRWLLVMVAMLAGCGGSPADLASSDRQPQGDGGTLEAGDEGGHAPDAQPDAPGAPEAGVPEAFPEAAPDADAPETGEDAATLPDAPPDMGPPTGTCPGGSAALGCTDFAGTPLCVAEGVNLTCSDFTFPSTSAAQAQYDQYKSAGYPDCQYGGQPVPNPRLTAPGQDCVILYGMQVQAFFARCPSGAIPSDGGC